MAITIAEKTLKMRKGLNRVKGLILFVKDLSVVKGLYHFVDVNKNGNLYIL